MTPARQDLPVTPGTTYRDTVRIMQPVYAYRDITKIEGAPVVLTVPGHGLASDWPVWVRGVQGMPEANREPFKQLPHRAKRLGVDSLEINPLSASGLKPTGGELIYQVPVDLTDAAAWLKVYRGDDLLFVLSAGAGLSITAPGTLTRSMTSEQTALLSGAPLHYTFDIQYPGLTIVRYCEGVIL
jgi:hypothetical protein